MSQIGGVGGGGPLRNVQADVQPPAAGQPPFAGARVSQGSAVQRFFAALSAALDRIGAFVLSLFGARVEEGEPRLPRNVVQREAAMSPAEQRQAQLQRAYRANWRLYQHEAHAVSTTCALYNEEFGQRFGVRAGEVNPAELGQRVAHELEVEGEALRPGALMDKVRDVLRDMHIAHYVDTLVEEALPETHRLSEKDEARLKHTLSLNSFPAMRELLNADLRDTDLAPLQQAMHDAALRTVRGEVNYAEATHQLKEEGFATLQRDGQVDRDAARGMSLRKLVSRMHMQRDAVFAGGDISVEAFKAAMQPLAQTFFAERATLHRAVNALQQEDRITPELAGIWKHACLNLNEKLHPAIYATAAQAAEEIAARGLLRVLVSGDATMSARLEALEHIVSAQSATRAARIPEESSLDPATRLDVNERIRNSLAVYQAIVSKSPDFGAALRAQPALERQMQDALEAMRSEAANGSVEQREVVGECVDAFAFLCQYVHRLDS